MMNTDHLPACVALTMFGKDFPEAASRGARLRSRAGAIAALMLSGALGLCGTAMAQDATPPQSTPATQNPVAGQSQNPAAEKSIDYAQTLDYTGITISEVGPGQGNNVPEVLDSGIGNDNELAQVVGGSAVEPVQSELTGSYLRAEITPQSLTDDTVDGDFTAGYHVGQTPMDRASRYYGSTVTGGDLTSNSYTDDQFNSDRGKVAKVPQRLGVFDRNHTDSRAIVIHPYIEVSQDVDSFYAPTSSELTYTDLVAGAEVTINGRNNQGTISARVDERLGYGTVANSTGVNGVASLSSAILPNTLRIDYGAYANETTVTPDGATFANTSVTVGQRQQIYALYAGPTLTTHLGDDIGITGHYRIGYTNIGETGYNQQNTLLNSIDVFGHSVVQDGRLSAGVRPGQLGWIGFNIIGGYYNEKVSNLDQVLTSEYARGEAIIPVTSELAIVGGGGYEKILVTSHDALRNSSLPGDPPILDANGRYITDYSSPLYTAMNVVDPIWDVGIEWRPSRRTNLEVHFGHRYGEFTGYGSFTYMPSPRQNFSIVYYNNLGGFGGDLNNTLSNLSSQFETVRDGITGNISSCLSTSASGGCLGGVLGSANSAFGLAHGATIGYDLHWGSFDFGVGVGYDIHRYITAAETIDARINGKADSYYWIDTFLGARINEKSQFQTTLNLYKYDSGLVLNSNETSLRVVSIYQYFPSKHLSFNASLALNASFNQAQANLWSSTLSMGVRYTF